MATNADILAILRPQLERDEGVETVAYLDNADPPNVTWGIGHKDNSVSVGAVFTMEQVDEQFALDAGDVFRGLDADIPWWRNMDAVRADVLCNIAFNVGVHGLMGFHRCLAACQAEDWPTASAEIIDSTLAPARRQRLADQMRTDIVQ